MKAAAAVFLALPALACIDVGTIQSQRPMQDAGGSQDAGDGGTEVRTVVCASCAPVEGCVSPTDDNSNLVAGLESGCNDPESRNGRHTFWFTFANGVSIVMPSTTMFVPACVGANGSCYAACVNGLLAGNSYPYAGMGVAWGLETGPYDLSSFTGVSFYVLGTIGAESRLRFSVPTVAVASVGSGGTCTGATACNDAYQTDVLEFLPGAPNTWQKVSIPFTMLRQIGFGALEPWDPAHTLSLTWVVYSPLETVLTDQDYSICVDQIELY